MRRFVPFCVFLVALLLLLRPAAAFEIKRVISPGGIEAWLVEDMKIPVIALSWSFEGAGTVSPPGKEGLANLAASTMDEGAGALDALAFRTRTADIAARLSFTAGRENFSGRLVTLQGAREEALELTRLALTSPRFDADAVERVRAQILAEVRRDAGDPNAIARKALNAALFAGHPYGVDHRGDAASLAAITRDDLAGFVRNQLSRDRLLVAAAGAISAEELGRALDKLFGGLPATGQAASVPPISLSRLGETIKIDFPSPQTIVAAAGPGIERQDPDYYAARLAVHILGGGGFSSRLMTEVREKRGLTYGVYAGLVGLDQAPLVYFGGSTQNPKAAEMLEISRRVWAEMGEMGASEAELTAAKSYLTGSLALQLDSTGTLSDFALQVRRDKLPIDIMDKRDALINAVTLDDVKRVSARLFDPAKLLTVLVGRPAGL
jgi:zinc protease